jgi:hypothetical protein
MRCKTSMEPFGVRPPGLVAQQWGDDEVPPLAMALSPSPCPELTESQVNAAAINGVQWVAD